jgi:hypothetical protein
MSTAVYINGTGLTGTKAISFGGTAAQAFSIVSDKLVIAWVGNGSSGDVSVTTAAGTSSFPGFTFIDTPLLLSFTPDSGTESSSITVKGLNFYAANKSGIVRKVTVGGTPVSSFYYKGTSDDNTIVLTLGTGSSGHIAVTTDKGIDSIPGFTYYPPAPYIDTFAPKVAGRGSKVIIDGWHLLWVKEVLFGGVPADSFVKVSNDTLIAYPGAGASGNITLVTEGGRDSISGFTWIPAVPLITGFSPASGPVGATLTITGANFNPVADNNVVYFGAVRAFVTAATTTSLTVTVPAGATYEPVSVTTDRVTGYSAKPFNITFPGGTVNDSTFAPRADFAVQAGSAMGVSVLIQDLDGDLRSDLTVTNRGDSDKVVILRNTSAQSALSFAKLQTLSSGGDPAKAISGDLDGDSKPDLAVTNDSDVQGIFTYRNKSTPGNISFGPFARPGTVSLPTYYPLITDFDLDGKPDVTLLSWYGKISLYENASADDKILFEPTRYYYIAPLGNSATWGANSITGGDVDGDGKPDLVFTQNYSTQQQKVAVWRNTSNEGIVSFAPPLEYITNYGPGKVRIADINDDGKPELIVSTYAQTVAIYQNNSSPGAVSFAAPVFFNTAAGPAAMAIADIDGDGRPDIAITNPSGKTISVLKNTSSTGNISFADKVIYATGSNPEDIAIGDLNGDGKPDLCVTNGKDSVSVFINRGSQLAMPLISSFTPTAAKSGDTVTIRGRLFTGATAVSFGGAAADSFITLSDSVITAIVGPGATGLLSVTTPNGAATIDSFIFLQPAPDLVSFSPATAREGTTVIIEGLHLADASAVSFGGIPAAAFTILSPAKISAVVGPGASGLISVTTPSGTDTLQGFGFLLPPPDLLDFAPDSAASGSSVTITGRYFTGATAVSFGNVPATAFTVTSDSTITAIVGAGANGAAKVSTAYGTDSLTGFTFIPSLGISAVNPAYGGEGRTIILSGNRFTGATAVYTSGVPAMAFKVLSDTTIQAYVGGNGNPNDSTIQVVTPAGTAVYHGFHYIVAPVITSFSPTSGGQGTIVTIVGSGFIQGPAYSAVDKVTFGDVPAAGFNIISPDTIIATVGTGESGGIAVWANGGIGWLDGFTFGTTNAPLLSSFSPAAAATNTTVTIRGKYFTGTTAVQFGNTPAASFSVVSDSVINAVTGSGSTGAVTVTTIAGSIALNGFTYIPPAPPAPLIYTFTPGSGGPGAVITIRGKYLTGISSLSFGGTAAAAFTVLSDTLITATVGSGASGLIKVSGPNGTASIGAFSYIPPPPPPPVIASFTPTSGGPGTVVTIRGAYLSAATALTFGGTAAASFSSQGDSTILAVVGNGSSGTVRVVSPDGIAMKSGFTYVPPRPVIASFTPTSGGPGTVVTIRGQYFTNASSVRFGGTTASFTIQSDSLITAYVGYGSSGEVNVIANGRIGALSGFTYIPPAPPSPLITGFTPGSADSGAVIMIRGRYFTNATAVLFGGIAASSFTVLSDTTISAVVGSGASGSVSVVTPVDTASLAGFTYLPPATPAPVSPAPQAGTISMYPNPASGYAWVEHPVSAKNTQLRLTDMMGNLLKIIAVPAGTAKTQVNTSTIPTGSYRITWSDGSITTSKTLMVVQ